MNYDECHTVKTICGPHASCHNTAGGFFCLCHTGFAQLSGKTNFTGYGAGCQDVDECLQQPCGPHGVCINAEGTFLCSHMTPPMTSHLQTTLSPFVHCLSNLLKDQSIIDNCFTKRLQQPPADQFCSLINSTLAFARRMCEQKGEYRQKSASVTLKDVTSFGNKFVADGSGVESATVFLGAMENFATLAALASPTQELKAISSAHLDLDVRVIDVTNRRFLAHERLTLRAKNDTLDIYMKTVTEEQQTGASVVVFLSYTDLRSLQRGEFVTEGQPQSHLLTSSVVSVVIGNRRHRQLRDGVNITLSHTSQTQGSLSDWRIFCVYWNHSPSSSHWSPEGCEVIQSNGTHTTCGCQHLSSFALLIATSKVTPPANRLQHHGILPNPAPIQNVLQLRYRMV
ncbi:adhesion G protein-coupled receptor E1-like [Amblyraja radiata]|uniref:adhesion G protein-coupled receptor E1-like n=1 Tax=Amblyraja radiata TaxID=386614 RepID=UPI0014023265|nr:adhesion G protein-coupled receptor E1-like [Amblyraja radiata]